MKDDPIVEEVRRVRHEYAAQFGFDIRRMVDDLRRREALHPERMVSYPPRPAPRRAPD